MRILIKMRVVHSHSNRLRQVNASQCVIKQLFPLD